MSEDYRVLDASSKQCLELRVFLTLCCVCSQHFMLLFGCISFTWDCPIWEDTISHETMFFDNKYAETKWLWFRLRTMCSHDAGRNLLHEEEVMRIPDLPLACTLYGFIIQCFTPFHSSCSLFSIAYTEINELQYTAIKKVRMSEWMDIIKFQWCLMFDGANIWCWAELWMPCIT